MTTTFTPAKKWEQKCHAALVGPSGSGKTLTGLILATELAQGGKVAVIDSERGKAALYADRYQFDHLVLQDHSAERYIMGVDAAVSGGYAALLIDSLSHEWAGRGGILESVDRAKANGRNNRNDFAAWADATPLHQRAIDAIVGAPLHVIVTMRTKVAYVLETNAQGKQVPRKIGLQPIQRDGVEYEFDVIGEMDQEHNLVITKTRCEALDGKRYAKPDAQLARTLLDWLAGETPPASSPATVPPSPAPSGPPPIRGGVEREVAPTKATPRQISAYTSLLGSIRNLDAKRADGIEATLRTSYPAFSDEGGFHLALMPFDLAGKVIDRLLPIEEELKAAAAVGA